MFYEGVKMYNFLLIELKKCKRVDKFKRMLENYILGEIL